MRQNVYDDPEFFEGYRHLRASGRGLNDVLEQPAFRKLLPSVEGSAVLDLGCGLGHLAVRLVELGAAKVVGIDISEMMLAEAANVRPHELIEYRQCAVEDASFDASSFDLVVSSLALHYVADYAGVVAGVAKWLKPGGVFLFSVEHPIINARKAPVGPIKDEAGKWLYWPVDNYDEEGPRSTKWFKDGVIKYHRRFTTYVNELIGAGLVIDAVDEPEPIPSALAVRPDLEWDRRRPPFLLVRCHKVG